MAVLTFYNDEINVIEAQLTDDITFECILSFIKDMAELSIKHENYQWLVDYTKAHFKLGTFEIYNLPKAAYNKLEPLGDQRDRLKRAIIRINDKEDFAFLYNVAQNTGQNLKVFDTREEALK